MSAPSTDSAMVTDLLGRPPVGPFFQQYYGACLHLDPDARCAQFVAGLPEKIRERLSEAAVRRLWAQVTAHREYPTRTHYATHELRVLEARLPHYELGLNQRLGLSAERVLAATKQILSSTLRLGSSGDPAPGKRLNVSWVDCASPALLERFVRPLCDHLNTQADTVEQRGLDQAIAAWLAGVPELLHQRLYSSPQEVTAALRADLAGTLSSLPLRLLAELCSKASCYDAVCFPSYPQWGATWQTITGVVDWYHRLIIVDTDCDADAALAECTTFEEYLVQLQQALQRPLPGVQFRRYLESATEVPLYRHEDTHYQECARLRRGDFRQVVHLVVTMDDLLAQLRRLQPIVAESENYTALAVSMHELMCYCDVLQSPAVLLHFMGQRQRALNNLHLEWSAELDHLSMQQTDANYADALDNLSKIRSRVQHPYRQEIDNHLQARLRDEFHVRTPPTWRRQDGSAEQWLEGR